MTTPIVVSQGSLTGNVGSCYINSQDITKELKDAGFPQGVMPYYDSDGYIHRTSEEETNWIYEPTLEELIEACGDIQFRLQSYDGGKTWVADRRDASAESVGSTPTEAVARLWLALNKK